MGILDNGNAFPTEMNDMDSFVKAMNHLTEEVMANTD